jgi:hypothetical protein
MSGDIVPLAYLPSRQAKRQSTLRWSEGSPWAATGRPARQSHDGSEGASETHILSSQQTFRPPASDAHTCDQASNGVWRWLLTRTLALTEASAPMPRKFPLHAPVMHPSRSSTAHARIRGTGMVRRLTVLRPDEVIPDTVEETKGVEAVFPWERQAQPNESANTPRPSPPFKPHSPCDRRRSSGRISSDGPHTSGSTRTCP